MLTLSHPFQLPKSTRSIDIQITGTGSTLLQLSYRYNMLYGNNFQHFQIQPNAQMLNAEEMLLEVCFSYPRTNNEADGATTDLIIMEANLPSGFTASDENSNELLHNEVIQRIELSNSETTLIVYFENLSGDIEYCFDVITDKIHDVRLRRPASVIVYDFYNISRYDAALYTIR